MCQKQRLVLQPHEDEPVDEGAKHENGEQMETQVLIEGKKYPSYPSFPSFLQMENITRYQSLAPAVVAAIAGSGTGWKMFSWGPGVGGGRLGEMSRSVSLD